MNTYRATSAQVNLQNLGHNYKQIKSYLPEGAYICPMVKANAYGHGAVEVSRTLLELGCDNLGVALVEEGIELRQAGVNSEILVFATFDSEALLACQEFQLTPVVSSLSTLELMTEVLTAPMAIHLKVNTGMNRLGLPIQQIGRFKTSIESNDKVILAGVCTHFASSEDFNSTDSFAREQLQKFNEFVDNVFDKKIIRHAYNSASMIYTKPLGLPNYGVRPGISMYGGQRPIGDPAFDEQLKLLDLKPVMRLESKVVHMQSIVAGESVSYNRTWRATTDGSIGILPIGYADGFNRRLGNNWQVLVADQLVPVVGTVCMDYIMVDLSHASGVSLDAPCVIFGDEQVHALTAAAMADKLDTITYEIFTSVGNRVPRVYKGPLCF